MQTICYFIKKKWQHAEVINPSAPNTARGISYPVWYTPAGNPWFESQFDKKEAHGNKLKLKFAVKVNWHNHHREVYKCRNRILIKAFIENDNFNFQKCIACQASKQHTPINSQTENRAALSPYLSHSRNILVWLVQHFNGKRIFLHICYNVYTRYIFTNNTPTRNRYGIFEAIYCNGFMLLYIRELNFWKFKCIRLYTCPHIKTLLGQSGVHLI